MHMSNCSGDVFSEPKLLFKPFIYSLIELIEKLLIEVYVQSILLAVNESAPKSETLCSFPHIILLSLWYLYLETVSSMHLVPDTV